MDWNLSMKVKLMTVDPCCQHLRKAFADDLPATVQEHPLVGRRKPYCHEITIIHRSYRRRDKRTAYIPLLLLIGSKRY